MEFEAFADRALLFVANLVCYFVPQCTLSLVLFHAIIRLMIRSLACYFFSKAPSSVAKSAQCQFLFSFIYFSFLVRDISKTAEPI